MTVKFEMDGPLAIAAFSAPPMNLLTMQILAEFEEAMEKALQNKARAFLTVAEGDHFCRGADVLINFQDKNGNDGRRMLNQGVSFIQRFERLPFPTVVAIRGMCLGGGCEIAQVHDIIFAGEKARLGQIEALIGTTTLLGGASRLVARVGLARAKEMVFSAGHYDAKTMQDWGLINQVFPDDEVEAKARAYAMKLANGPTVAYGISKSLINMTVNHGVSAADALVVEAAPQTLDTKDMKTAVKHYVEGGVEALLKGVPFKGE
jgi:enoyl-CoA hydratase/carnithine racemase